MQWRAAVVVAPINIGTTVYQLIGHSVLPRVAGHVQRSVSISICFINLRDGGGVIKLMMITIMIIKERREQKIILSSSYRIL